MNITRSIKKQQQATKSDAKMQMLQCKRMGRKTRKKVKKKMRKVKNKTNIYSIIIITETHLSRRKDGVKIWINTQKNKIHFMFTIIIKEVEETEHQLNFGRNGGN